ncbi:23S rRNA methyltransferase [Solibacillus merdavium]|uniref:23S rRNA methyltransferase n=1 Tax=Solibacillus merdavium TaxID=2762218 RepID=A0ABR8XRA0_9BACL|nr:23S rRNA methyltransferase [Solibacillus merdavium]MBD8034467.1 23S rRNA methyltransferase [Solibacillus merdavium]
MRSSILFLITAILLAGCGETIGDVKKAAAGINSKANEAATAISTDVHSIRSVEIEFDNETFTINDLFKTILRDVQWYYDENEDEQQLKITGTWQDNGLFADGNFSEAEKQQLIENSKIEVVLYFHKGVLEEKKTTVSMNQNGQTIIDQKGSESLHHFYKVYTMN